MRSGLYIPWSSGGLRSYTFSGGFVILEFMLLIFAQWRVLQQCIQSLLFNIATLPLALYLLYSYHLLTRGYRLNASNGPWQWLLNATLAPNENTAINSRPQRCKKPSILKSHRAVERHLYLVGEVLFGHCSSRKPSLILGKIRNHRRTNANGTSGPLGPKPTMCLLLSSCIPEAKCVDAGR